MNWSHPAFELIAQLLKGRTGLHFSDRRREEAELGIRRAMRGAGVADPEEYAARIASDGQAIDELIVEMAVTESYFFREPAQFEMIRNEALPEIRRRLGDKHFIRAWSAGCAAGEEPFSLAIVLDQEGLADRAHIQATDISRRALEQARGGIYDAWAVRYGAVEMARGRLHSQDGRYAVDKRLLSMVTFQYHNLVIDLYPSDLSGIANIDLILCRNVLIYFEEETMRTVVRRLFDSLAPGGWLITASTDPPLTGLSLTGVARFEIVKTSAGVAYRKPVSAEFFAPPEFQEMIGGVLPPDLKLELPLASASARPAEVSAPAAVAEPLAAAQQAFARGDYRQAAELAPLFGDQPAACELQVLALANLDLAEAEVTCASAVARHASNVPLRYLHAVLLIGLGRDIDALEELRQAIYFDRSQPLPHFTLGSIFQRLGELRKARQAYRNAQRLCEAIPPDAIAMLSDGETAAKLAEACAERIAILDQIQEPTR